MDNIDKIRFNDRKSGSILYNAHGGGGHGGGGGGRHGGGGRGGWGGRGRGGWGGWGGWYPYPYYGYPYNYPYWEYPYAYGNVVILDDKKKKEKKLSAGGGAYIPPPPPPPVEEMSPTALKQIDCAQKTGFNLQDLNPKAMTVTQGMNREAFDKCMRGEEIPKPEDETPKPKDEGKKFDITKVPSFVWAGAAGAVAGGFIAKANDKNLWLGALIGGVVVGGIVAAATYKPTERKMSAAGRRGSEMMRPVYPEAGFNCSSFGLPAGANNRCKCFNGEIFNMVSTGVNTADWQHTGIRC